jgi:hypothetical protein
LHEALLRARAASDAQIHQFDTMEHARERIQKSIAGAAGAVDFVFTVEKGPAKGLKPQRAAGKKGA